MNRVEQSDLTYQRLFGKNPVEAPLQASNPELQTILNRLIFGEVFVAGSLPDTTRELITVVTLTVLQTMDPLRAHVGAALHVGVSPVQVQEAIYQCAPYIGFPKTIEALQVMNQEMAEHGIALPLPLQGRTTEQDRLEKGMAVQKQIFGKTIDQMRAQAPAEEAHIQDYLSAFCFGDFYTRDGLSLQMRELLTLCMLVALGGCENQIKAHLRGNLQVGNDVSTMLDALTQCLPYVGFPRTLNALACLHEAKEK